MSNVYATSTITSAGSKQVLNFDFDGYQVKDTLISNKLYLDGSSYENGLGTAVGTATTSIEYTNTPLAGELFGTVYDVTDTEANRPLVGLKKDVRKITTTVVDTGRIYTVNWNMSLDSWFVFVVKSTGTSVAGKIKIRRSSGNEVVCPFTTSATANTWTRAIFDFKNITPTGNPGLNNWTDITEVEITLDAANNITGAMFYAVPDYSMIIGNRVMIRTRCINEFAITNTIETANLMCKQEVEQTTATGRTFEITSGAKKKDVESNAIALGDLLTREVNQMIDIVNSNEFGKRAFTTDSGQASITLPIGLNLHSVYANETNLKPFHSATAVPTGAYFYDSATGKLTVNIGYVNKIPTVEINNAATLPTYSVKGLELGFVGKLRIQRKLENGKRQLWTQNKVQVVLDSEGMNEDFDQDNFKYMVYKDGNGRYSTVGTEI